MKIETVINWDFAGNWLRDWCRDPAMQTFRPWKVSGQNCKYAFATPDNTIEHIELVKDQLAVIFYDLELDKDMSVRWESSQRFLGAYFDFSDMHSLDADIPVNNHHDQYFIGYSSSFFKPTFTLLAARRMKGMSIIISEDLLHQLIKEHGTELAAKYMALLDWETLVGSTYINKSMVSIFHETRAHASGDSDPVFKKIHLQGNVYRLLSVFLAQLLEPGSKEVSCTRDDIRRLVIFNQQIIDEQLKDLPRLEAAAQMVNMSASTFKRNFKAVFNDSYYHYYRDIKLEKAKALLIEGQLSIKLIAAQLGYDSGDSLTKAYRQKFGKLPVL